MSERIEWSSVDAAIEDLKSHSDDIDSVRLRILEGTWRVGATTITGAFLEVHLCNGSKKLVSLDVAEALLNDGILSRLRVRLKLDLERKSSPPEEHEG